MAKKESKKTVDTKVSKKPGTATVKTSKKTMASKKALNTADKTVGAKHSALKKIFRSPFRGYFVGSWRELREVEWPDRKTSWKLTFIVIMFSVVFSLFTAGLDVGFEKVAKQIFLK